MHHVRLGSTGLVVSRICLGCMSYGEPGRGNHGWTLPEAESRPFVKKALDLGINFFDTANVYSAGSSEEIVGQALLAYVPREEVVIATKVHGRMRPGPNGAGLSRKAILQEIDASLRRLGTDYVDLYQIHRWDGATPIEETLEALNDVVRAGKARYIGASSMFAWQFAKALAVSDAHGWARFVSMQNYVNALYREEEREMLPLCRADGIGVLPWSPLGGGKLTRPWGEVTKRNTTDRYNKGMYADPGSNDHAVVAALEAVSKARGIPMAQVAMAWVLQVPGVSSPIVGASKLGHVDDAIAAVEVKLSADEVKALEAPYQPRFVTGF